MGVSVNDEVVVVHEGKVYHGTYMGSNERHIMLDIHDGSRLMLSRAKLESIEKEATTNVQ